MNLKTLLACFVLLQASIAFAQVPADPELAEVELKRMTVAHDGKGHYLAVQRLRAGEYWSRLFYGDGKTFHEQQVLGHLSDGESESLDFWDPRNDPRISRMPSIKVLPEHGILNCSERTVTVPFLDKAASQAIVAKAKFFKPKWKRRAFALARDDKGTYFYVDRLRADHATGYRLFLGPRGNLQLQKMINVVDDSEGQIFTTADGALRLVLGSDTKWVSGQSESKLIPVPIGDNARFIYTDLGVYLGERLGTPCDDL